MKRAWRHIVMAGLAVLCSSACIREENPGGTEKEPGQENGAEGPKKKYYVDIAVRAAGDEKSGDFVDGSCEWEHLIGPSCNYAFFFDKNEKLYAVSEMTLVKRADHHPEEENIEARYWTQFYADDNGDLPRYCLVILNAQRLEETISSYEDDKTKTVNDILALTWPQEANPADVGFSSDNHEYFTLTNSVYFDGTGKLRAAAEIDETMLQEERTEDGETVRVLTVHVERMVSKFNFSIEENHVALAEGQSVEFFQPSTTPDIVLFDGFHTDGSPKYTAKRWRIEVTGWGINALENGSYLFKQVSANGDYFAGWNDPGNYRTYWCEDRTYKNEKYPWQYRPGGYEPAASLPYYAAAGTDADGVTKLNNYSFAALDLGKKNDGEDRLAHFGRILYAPESTFDAEAVRGTLSSVTSRSRHDDRDEMLAATHLLIGAELQIEMNGDERPDVYAPTNVYRERSGFFYLTERDCFAVQVHAFNQLLTSQKSMDFIYYKWDNLSGQSNDSNQNNDKLSAKPAEINTSEGYYNGNYDFGLYWLYNGTYTLLNDAFFETDCPDQSRFEALFGSLAPGNLPGGDGQRLPWPAKGKLVICNSDHVPVEIYTRDVVQEGEKITRDRLRPANDNDVKSLLYEWLGAIDHFKDGKMYYACGIEQNPGSTGTATTSEDGETVHVNTTGRYGTVRNNWYRFNLKKISGLGVPVDDPDQPIVPDRAGPNDQINVTVSILDWHFESSEFENVNAFNQ